MENNPETIEEWMRRIGSKEAMRERQEERQAGLINQPIKGPRGLANCVHAMRKTIPHALDCRCATCEPQPVTVIPTAKVPRKPRRKWEQRGSSSN